MNARSLALAALVFLALVSRAEAQAVTNPHGELPQGLECTSCHTTEGWSPLRADLAFDHASDTGFPLEGRHGDLTCAGCHTTLAFDDLGAEPDDCASCHLDVHQGTTLRPCASCHTTASFSDLALGVVHPANFPLEGAHLQTSCESCHTSDLGGAFAPLDTDCVSCHMGDYLRSSLVNHQALGFPTQCLDCHSTLDFRDVAFDHFEISGGFALLGRHAGISCTSCHSLPGGGIPSSPTGPEDCVACHLADYQEQHGGSGYPTTCTMCHDVFSWDAAEFDHAVVTGFELIPNHDRLTCSECHVGSTAETFFHPTDPQDCYACHQSDYDREHRGSGTPTDCLRCHRATTWGGASFDHLAVSGFELIPNHDLLTCAECHVGGTSATIFHPTGPQDCYTCHVVDYEGQHQGSGVSTDCAVCHQITTWTGATFDHLAVTGFALLPNHDRLACAACHVAGSNATFFSPAGPQDCVTCHQADYDRQHQGTGTSTTCTDCHETTTWGGAAFDHLASTGFELLPNHDQLACASCHVAGSNATFFNPTGPDDCVTCHQADYDGQHLGSGFSTNCLACHQSTTWLGATFFHDFPITSGPHVVATCADCHTVPQDFTSFSCLGCHAHRQSAMDARHSGRNGYSYESNACLSCHPRGRA